MRTKEFGLPILTKLLKRLCSPEMLTASYFSGVGIPSPCCTPVRVASINAMQIIRNETNTDDLLVDTL